MNNEILNKLIELGYLKKGSGRFIYDLSGDYIVLPNEFKPRFNAVDFLFLQRALFDECGKKNYIIEIDGGLEFYAELKNDENVFLFSLPDTSRESFIQAFCKVTGVE